MRMENLPSAYNGMTVDKSALNAKSLWLLN